MSTRISVRCSDRLRVTVFCRMDGDRDRMDSDIQNLKVRVTVYVNGPKPKRSKKKVKEPSIPNPIFREVVTIAGFEKLATEMVKLDTKKFPDDLTWTEASDILCYEAGFPKRIYVSLKIIKPRRLRGKVVDPKVLLGLIRDHLES